ncbi:multidrug and toxin extrusion protein 1-like [Tubulanus polymorphus]|uniref:multidrug and toxin extrusion protein 1-like n=1 Tax=Tubulanus polymorphus TaxID=672921 RepID=UPI003DA308A0
MAKDRVDPDREGHYNVKHAFNSTAGYSSIGPIVEIEHTAAKACPCFPSWYRREAKTAFGLAWPMVMTTLFNFLMAPISLIFVGKLGTVSLGGAALANTVINVFGIAVGVGVSSAVDTLISQTYGAKNDMMIGIILQRSLMIVSLFVVPCWVLHLNITSIFILIGQDRETSIIAGDYVLYFMPGLLFDYIYQVLTKYLYNQNIVYPGIVFGIIGSSVNVIGHLILVDLLGTNGSAIAQVITYFSMVVCALVYIFWSGVYKNNWPGWSVESFQEWGPFFSLGIPGLLMVFLEWGSFEIGTILTGLLDVVQLDAQAIGFQIQSICYMVPLGFSISANIRVGQLLGNGEALQAKRAALACLSMVCCTAVTVAVIVASLRTVIPLVFTVDEEVISYASIILAILAAYEILDSMASVGAGVLRGCGRQNIGASIIFVGYILVALPTGISLMFLTDLKAIGLWFGLMSGLIVVNVSYVFLFLRMNWDEQAKNAKIRAGIAARTAAAEKETGETKFVTGAETDPLLISERSQKRTSFDYSSTNINKDYKSKLTSKELIYRRGLTFMLAMMLIAIGIYMRLTFRVERCVLRPENGTQPLYNSTLPFCSQNHTLFV